jgi:hypothetical protein
MPWTILLNKWLWVALALAGLSLALAYERHGKIAAQTALTSEKAAFGLFKEEVRQAGEKAAKDAKEKETRYALQTKSAIAARDDALRRLRESANRPIGGFVPADTRPASAGGICYDPPALDAAIRRFAAGVQGLIIEGDAASLDAKALIQGWPR